MHTASSAKRTCRARASTSEWTATVFSPSSRQARRTRSAISPRFAIRIFLNITPDELSPHHEAAAIAPLRLLDSEKLLSVLNALAVLGENFGNRAGAFRLDFVHELHRLDDAERLPRAHDGANVDERGYVG